MIHLCDARTGKPLRSWGVGGTRDLQWVNAVAFSPDWKLLACGREDGVLEWWDVATQKRLHLGKLPAQFKDSTGGLIGPMVQTVAFSPDGKLVASGDTTQAVRLWDVATGETIAAFEGHKGVVYGVTFSPDGKTLASVSEDKTALIWKVP